MSEETKSAKGTAVAIQSGPRGLQLQSLDDMWRFATCVCASGLAPKGVATPEAVVVAVQMGSELGLPPMAALQNIAVINGRPSVWGDAMPAVCRGSGKFDDGAFNEVISGTGDALEATCTVRRLGDAKPVTRTFSVADAKKAGLWDKQGPWQQYPKRMLQMRARSWALRDAFPDVLRGFQATEEVMDIPPAQAVGSRTESLAQRLSQEAEPAVEPPFNPPTLEETESASEQPAFAHTAEDASHPQPKPAKKTRKKPAAETQVDPAVEKTDGVDEATEGFTTDQQNRVDDYTTKTVDATSLAALKSLEAAKESDGDLWPNAKSRVQKVIDARRGELAGRK